MLIDLNIFFQNIFTEYVYFNLKVENNYQRILIPLIIRRYFCYYGGCVERADLIKVFVPRGHHRVIYFKYIVAVEEIFDGSSFSSLKALK